jgi:hypothetical protein
MSAAQSSTSHHLANSGALNAGGTQGKGKAAMTSGLSSVVSSSSSSSGSLKERRLKNAFMSSKAQPATPPEGSGPHRQPKRVCKGADR